MCAIFLIDWGGQYIEMQYFENGQKKWVTYETACIILEIIIFYYHVVI